MARFPIRPFYDMTNEGVPAIPRATSEDLVPPFVIHPKWREGLVIIQWTERSNAPMSAPTVRLMIDGEFIPPSDSIYILSTTLVSDWQPSEEFLEGGRIVSYRSKMKTTFEVEYADLQSEGWIRHQKTKTAIVECSDWDISEACPPYRVLFVRPINFGRRGPTENYNCRCKVAALPSANTPRLEGPEPLRLTDGK